MSSSPLISPSLHLSLELCVPLHATCTLTPPCRHLVTWYLEFCATLSRILSSGFSTSLFIVTEVLSMAVARLVLGSTIVTLV